MNGLPRRIAAWLGGALAAGALVIAVPIALALCLIFAIALAGALLMYRGPRAADGRAHRVHEGLVIDGEFRVVERK